MSSLEPSPLLWVLRVEMSSLVSSRVCVNMRWMRPIFIHEGLSWVDGDFMLSCLRYVFAFFFLFENDFD
jgi:hypothetical protein